MDPAHVLAADAFSGSTKLQYLFVASCVFYVIYKHVGPVPFRTCGRLALVLAMSYVVYHVVEQPGISVGNRLAAAFEKWVDRRMQPPPPVLLESSSSSKTEAR